MLGHSSPLFQFPPSLSDSCLVTGAFRMSPSGDSGERQGFSLKLPSAFPLPAVRVGGSASSRVFHKPVLSFREKKRQVLNLSISRSIKRSA